MRLMRLAAVVAVSLCLATAAYGSSWTGGDGDWGLGTNWDAGVPDGTSAYIGNGQTVTLDTGVPAITTLDVTWFSELNIKDGAGLTAIGDANVAGGGNDSGIVAQIGGVVSLASNLTIGNTAGDIAKWTMTDDGSLAVGIDLTVGGAGQGTFELGDDSSLTVGGSIDIGESGSGMMTVGGGTLTQIGGAFTVGVGGSLRVEGDAPVINVANYEQAVSGALHLELNNSGIAPINISGNMTLNGGLYVSVASGAVPAPGIYDILVADGTRSGEFFLQSLPDGMALRYAEDSAKAQLYVGVEAPPQEQPIPTELTNYWTFDGSLTDTASDFNVNDSHSETNFDGGYFPTGSYTTLDSSNNGPFDVGAKVLKTFDESTMAQPFRAYLTDGSLNNTHDVVLGASYTVAFWMCPQNNQELFAWVFSDTVGHWDTGGVNILDMEPGYTPPNILAFSEKRGSGEEDAYAGATLGAELSRYEWYYITLTHDGESDRVYMYVNGSLDPGVGSYGQASTRPGPWPGTTSQFMIGNSSAGNKLKYSGHIWYGRMSTWADYLTPDQAAQLYANGGIPLEYSEAVPEPASLGLIGLALLAVRKRRS